jgi:hypothetical protein
MPSDCLGILGSASLAGIMLQALMALMMMMGAAGSTSRAGRGSMGGDQPVTSCSTSLVHCLLGWRMYLLSKVVVALKSSTVPDQVVDQWW